MVKSRSRLEKVKERGGHRLVFFSLLKGQLISKCLFGVIKKENVRKIIFYLPFLLFHGIHVSNIAESILWKNLM